ncbi:hypothetical protein [Aquariibacter albus]|uniref:Uncharacterized protein n=1 Tax=Aquariibacter albus TaxID=2759899 RepID=A0A839HHI8_9BURK|nr:hypothetical protein [Aquariibacter albus]MBB1161927.1 hypothetical protein [Aquariibacter albus]
MNDVSAPALPDPLEAWRAPGPFAPPPPALGDEAPQAAVHRLDRWALRLGAGLWGLLLLGTAGGVLLPLALGLLIVALRRSARLDRAAREGLRVDAHTLPALHARWQALAGPGSLRRPQPALWLLPAVAPEPGATCPAAQVLRGPDGGAVLLPRALLEVLADDPQALDFQLGRALACLRHASPWAELLRLPARVLPLLGPALDREREAAADRAGLRAAGGDPAAAARALLRPVLGATAPAVVRPGASGPAPGLLAAYQALRAPGRPLSARVAALQQDEELVPAAVQPLAWALALFTPHPGRAPAWASLAVGAAALLLLAAAQPVLEDRGVRQRLAVAHEAAKPVAAAVSAYHRRHGQGPAGLGTLGLPAELPGGLGRIELDAVSLVLTLRTPDGVLLLEPRLRTAQGLRWFCVPGPGLALRQAPAECRGEGPVWPATPPGR